MFNIKFLLIPLLSGILIALPFSYPALFLLSWIGLIPFLLFMENKKENNDLSFISVFTAGTLMGTMIIVFSSSWLYYPLIDFSGLPWLVGIFLLVLLFLLLGAIYGLWAVLFVYTKKSTGISPFWLAFSWTTIEYLRFLLVPAYPFAFLAYTQSSFHSLLQFAEYGGIYLVGFIVLLINAYLAKVLIKKKLRYAIPMVLLFIVLITTGLVKDKVFKAANFEYLKVGVVQTNIDPVDKWKVDNIEVITDLLIVGSKDLAGDSNLIVWPETALTFDLVRNEFYRERFLKKTGDIDAYIQVSCHAVKDDSIQQYNSSFLLTPSAGFEGRYNKMKLVPFGEYMPLSGLVEKLTGIAWSSPLAGNEPTIFSMDENKWRVAICSEILYPHLVQLGIDEADFIVNQSNEAWYKRGNLQQQMWAAATFRAVENRRSVVKSGNYALGGVISLTGSAISKEHSRNSTVFSAELPLNKEETFYQRYGDYVGFFSSLIVLFLLLIRITLSCLPKEEKSRKGRVKIIFLVFQLSFYQGLYRWSDSYHSKPDQVLLLLVFEYSWLQ